MKLIRLVIIIVIATFLNSCNATCQPKEPKLTLKAVLKGSYILSSNDEFHYFLVDVKLCNNTDSTFNFVAYSCETSLSLIVDYKPVIICSNKCGGNFPRLIEINANQTFTVPIILKVNRYNDVIDKPIKIGLVLLRCDDFSEAIKLILQKKERNEDIIWSDPFFLDGFGQPYEIY